MKILVLMPLSESHSHIAMAIHKAMPHEVKDKTFIMPAYIDYLLTTGAAENSIYAVSNALLSAQILYKQAEEKKEDIIIFGNIDKAYKFDAIFSCQDDKVDMPYVDGRAVKMQELVKGSDVEYIAKDLYTAADSQMILHNPVAIADFLTAYLDTDPHLEEIAAEYADRLKFLEGVSNNGDN